jgi:hypothetical protein
LSRWCTKHLPERSYDELRLKDHELTVKSTNVGLGKAQQTTHKRIQEELQKRIADKQKESSSKS